MKFFSTFIIVALLSSCMHKSQNADTLLGDRSAAEKAIEVKNRSLFPSGNITAIHLKEKHPKFFHPGSFTFDEGDVEKLIAHKRPFTIVTYFGLWCHDSQREVPRLLSMLERINNPNITHQLIALDVYKQEPKNRQQQDNIKFTPTFIIKNSGKEIGRIVEKPKQNLAKDLIKILKL